MKKLVSVISLVALICITSICVYGAEFSVDYQNGNLSIKGSGFNAPTVGMSVLPVTTSSDEYNSFYAAILELEVDKNNNFYQQITMPNITQNGASYPSGYYDVGVYDITSTRKKETFFFVNESIASGALNDISGKTITMDMLNTYKLELGISEDLVSQNINNEKLVKYINFFKPQATLTSDEFIKVYISALLCGGKEYSFDDFLVVLRGNQGVLKCADNMFFNVDTTLQNKIYKNINQLSVFSDTDFNSILENATFIEQINGENDSRIYTKLITTDYKNFLNMDMGSYNKLKSPESVVLNLMDTTFSSVDQFKEAFKKAVENQKNVELNWGNGASSGSGNSSSSGSGRFDGSYTANSEIDQTPDSATVIFLDVENHWAKDAVYYLQNKGIVDGVGNNNFMPDNKVTRAEFSKMIYNSLVSEVSIGDARFTDVKSSDWFNTYVCALSNEGIINGVGNGLFDPNATITRQDASVIIKRALDYKKIHLHDERETVNFSDDLLISDYAKEAVDTLYKSKLINGKTDGSFAPITGLTRAEAAQLIYNILTKGVI